MTGGLVVLAVFALAALFCALFIRADRKDQAAHDAWFNDPRHIWNQGKEAMRKAASERP